MATDRIDYRCERGMHPATTTTTTTENIMRYTMPRYRPTKVWVTDDEAYELVHELNKAFPLHGMCRSGADYLRHKGYVEAEFIEETDKDIFLNIINNWR